MKKIIKSLLLGAVVIGMAVGCQDTPSSAPSSNTSSISESRTSENPFTSSITSSNTVNPVITEVTLNVLNVKRTYEQGEALNLTGLEVTAKYSDGSSKKVTDYTTNPANGTVLNEIGTVTVTVTYGEYIKSFAVEVGKATKKGWTTEEANIMSTHLYGVVLPYNGLEESVVAYDEEADWVTISGGRATNNTLAAYANLLVQDGFARINNNNYVYEKAVSTSEGNRYVRVGFLVVEEAFMLQAYDPYLYTFPTDFAQMLAEDAFYSNDVPPAYNGANYYETSTSNLAIFCYTNSPDAEYDYTLALAGANWQLGANTHKDHKYAVSPDGKYAVYYKYNDQYKSLDIYFGPLYYWNSKVIEDFYKKYNGEVINIPAFNVEDGEYVFKESDVNEEAYAYGAYEVIHAFMYIYGTTAEVLPSYATILEQNGWEVEKSGNVYYAYYTIADKGVARLEFDYSDKHNAVIVTIYYMLDPIPYTDWPAQEVADLLGKYTMDTVPAFTANNKGFVILNDMFGTAVMVKVTSGTTAEATAHYKEVLEAAGYTKKNDSYYSPHSEISIDIESADSRSITISFRKTGVISVFPVQFLKEYYNTKDTIPAMDNANYYSFQIVDDRITKVTCNYSSADARSDAKTMYTGLLGQAGYSGTPETGLVSPSRDLVVTITGNENDLYIEFNGDPKSDFVSLWPALQISSLFAAEGYTDPLPSYDKVCDDISAGKNYDGSIFVLIETGNKDKVLSEYCGLLAGAGFSVDYTEENQYKSPNNQYSVKVSKNSLGVDLKIVSLGGSGQHGDSTEFPMAQLIADIPEAQGVVPGFWEDETLSFSYDYYFGMAFITVYSDPAPTAGGALLAYEAILEANGFHFETLYGYWDVYVSSNRAIAIELDDTNISDGQFVVGVSLI